MSINSISREEYKLLEKCKSQFLIGELDHLAETNAGPIRYFVDIKCNDLAPLQEMPDIFDDMSIYSGDDYHQIWNNLIDYYDPKSDYSSSDDRFDKLYEFLNEKLIIFIPEYNKNKDGKWFKNLTIYKVVDNMPLDTWYYNIPRVQMEPSLFEDRLKSGTYFELQDYDSDVMGDEPNIILCASYAYVITPGAGRGIFDSYQTKKDRWKCNKIEAIKKVNYTEIEGFNNHMVRVTDSIYFMDDELRNKLCLIKKNESFEIDKKKTVVVSKELEEQDEVIGDNEEVKFLRGLQKLTINNGLQYEFEDLVNFHTSLKTNPLTILAGMSGTGKTQLAYNYAKMLGLSEENNTLLFMPISPAYTEPSDVLGYLNSMNGLYTPAETGLVKFLLHANEDKEHMHLVIFDEMNLSQVEYWFSPFISILEKDLDERYLKLYDEDAHCINSKVFPSEIKIGENIIFIGTVNIDETTKDFSNRLSDRTFVINLKKVGFSEFFETYKKTQTKLESIDVNASKCKDVTQFMSWTRNHNINYMDAFKNEEILFLDELDILIRKYIPDGGISYRVLRNIGNYIRNVPNDTDETLVINRGKVLDTVLNQTIMPKIRGTESQLRELIGFSSAIGAEIESSELLDLLDKYSDISEFSELRRTINKKAEEMRINGYTN